MEGQFLNLLAIFRVRATGSYSMESFYYIFGLMTCIYVILLL